MTETGLRKLGARRILLTGVAVFALAFVAVTLAITGYATVLGFRARAAPDPERISRFAERAVPWLAAGSNLALAFWAALWSGRRVEHRAALHGLLVAAVAALCGAGYGVATASLAWIDLPLAAGMLLAGWSGGKCAASLKTRK